jgi:hypothetical protein
MKILWLVKLYWVWIILGLLVVVPSVIPPGISVTGAVLGAVLLLVGLVARKAMQSESLRGRIDRNL